MVSDQLGTGSKAVVSPVDSRRLLRSFGRVVAGVAAALAVSCGGKVCAGVGLERIVPDEATIAIGQQIIPLFQQGGGCVTSNTVTDAHYETVPARWSTRDTSIVSVDSLTGVVTGRKVGDAQVSPRAPSGIVLTVHVR